MSSLLALCHWLEGTQASSALRESIWVYPLVESLHVLTLAVFLGLTVVLDLRLLGLALRATPVSQAISRFMPWMIGGFLVMLTSGVLLFYAVPVRTYQNVFFRVKVLLLLLAGLNAALFHVLASRTLSQWDHQGRPPWRVRVAGGLSLALWGAIVVCGRMIAYNWFDADAGSALR
jgi:uncharacterized protein DUF6644